MDLGYEQIVTKEYWFEMAHRLKGQTGGFYSKAKCGSLHGHSVKVIISARLKAGASLDTYGFVMDFADFKPVKKWIDENLDHATLVGGNDEDLIGFLQTQGDRHFVFPEGAASSENIALLILKQSQRLLANDRIEVTEVRIAETCSSEAAVRLK